MIKTKDGFYESVIDGIKVLRPAEQETEEHWKRLARGGEIVEKKKCSTDL